MVEKDSFNGMFAPAAYENMYADMAAGITPWNGPDPEPAAAPVDPGFQEPEQNSWLPSLPPMFGKGSPILDPSIFAGPFAGLFD